MVGDVKSELKPVHRGSWKYGEGDSPAEKLTEAGNLAGQQYNLAAPEERVYRVKSEKSGEQPEDDGEGMKDDLSMKDGGRELELAQGNCPQDSIKSALVTGTEIPYASEFPDLDSDANMMKTGATWEPGHQSVEIPVDGGELESEPAWQLGAAQGNGPGSGSMMTENGVGINVDLDEEPGWQFGQSGRDSSISSRREMANASTPPFHRMPHEEVPQPNVDEYQSSDHGTSLTA